MRQIASFPFGHRHRWAEGMQEAKILEGFVVFCFMCLSCSYLII